MTPLAGSRGRGAGRAAFRLERFEVFALDEPLPADLLTDECLPLQSLEDGPLAHPQLFDGRVAQHQFVSIFHESKDTACPMTGLRDTI